jgi:hypothetical protein
MGELPSQVGLLKKGTGCTTGCICPHTQPLLVVVPVAFFSRLPVLCVMKAQRGMSVRNRSRVDASESILPAVQRHRAAGQAICHELTLRF